MHIGHSNFGHGGAQMMRNTAQTEHMPPEPRMSRGERIVDRLDKDGDGKIGMSDLQGSKMGRRMSVDKFARLDANQDGGLDAGELNDGLKRRGRGHRHHDHHHFNRMSEAMFNARTEHTPPTQKPPEPDPTSGNLAARLVAHLDGDNSGALNSEEIAGTRLGEAIAGDFYDLDGDKNGALDVREIDAFLEARVMGLADPVAPTPVAPTPDETDPGEVADVGATDEVAVEPTPEEVEVAPIPETPNAPGGTTPGGNVSATTTNAMKLTSAFEAALEILKDSPQPAQSQEAVMAFYESAMDILNAA